MRYMAFFVILFTSCTSVFYSTLTETKYRTADQVNAKLLDTSFVDTVQWQIAYAAYLKEINPTNRRIEDLESMLLQNENFLLNTLLSHSTELNLTNSDSIHFLVLANGDFKLTCVNSNIITDTILKNKINAELIQIKLPPSKEGNYCTIFKIQFSTITGGKYLLKLNSDIIYGEGGRSRKNIMSKVMKYLPKMRYAYNRRLRVKPGINGKITVKFAIDAFGRVIYAQRESSTIKDTVLNDAIVQQIKNWKFGYLNSKNDITEVIYPFMFSQEHNN